MAVDPSKRQLKTQARAQVVAHVRATQPDCWLCGYPINLAVPARTPLASTVDEIIPRSRGGSATDLANTRHAHLTCNATRGNRAPTPAVLAACRARAEAHMARPTITVTDTSRTW